MKNKTNNLGFTLIELLIVIAIIGILASFIVASMSESRTQAQDAQRVNDLKQLQVAMELYYNREVGGYPVDFDALNASGRYIESIPHDPISTRNGGALDYQIHTLGTRLDYALAARDGEDAVWCRVSSAGYPNAGEAFSAYQECPFY